MVKKKGGGKAREGEREKQTGGYLAGMKKKVVALACAYFPQEKGRGRRASARADCEPATGENVRTACEMLLSV